MTLYNYRSRQVHETLNGVNPSSSFRDMRSAKLGRNLWLIWQVFGPWASPYGANGHMTVTVHTYRPRQFHRTSNGENPSSGYRDTGSASLAAARPAARTVTTIPLQPGGLRDKNGWIQLQKHSLDMITAHFSEINPKHKSQHFFLRMDFSEVKHDKANGFGVTFWKISLEVYKYFTEKSYDKIGSSQEHLWKSVRIISTQQYKSKRDRRWLTRWSLMMYICIWIIIGSGNGLLSVWY